MSFVTKLVIVATTALSLGSVACVVGETKYETIEYDPHLAVAGLRCSGTPVKPDLSTLKACKAGGGKGTGKGHCYSRLKAGIDEANGKEFADPTCGDGEICVGDNILEAEGGKLKTCTFTAAGAPQPGVCMENLSAQMATNFALLKKGDTECEETQACTPCINPITKEDTKLCGKIGVFDKECTEGAKGKQVELCCAGLGQCMPTSSVPGGAGEDLPKDSCSQKDEAHVCAPSALIDGKGEKCSLAGADGVCLPFCFADVVKGAQAGIRSSCNALSFCLPCAAAKAKGFDMPGCE